MLNILQNIWFIHCYYFFGLAAYNFPVRVQPCLGNIGQIKASIYYWEDFIFSSQQSTDL